jgi:hypothetical protein
MNLATIIDGPRGSKHLTSAEVRAMSRENQAALAAGIQAATLANPGLKVKISDTALGGITIEWSTK